MHHLGVMNVNFNISVTGVPGTGKTTLCKSLGKEGWKILDLNEFALETSCVEGDIVDLDCLIPKINPHIGAILDSHYSHLVPSFAVIIMECSPEILRTRLADRRYDKKKIEENVDCLLSDCIGSECAENYPENRILRLNSGAEDEISILEKAVNFISKMEMKHNGT